MSLSCVLSVDHVAQLTGDLAVPAMGTRLDMTLRRVPGRQMSCVVGAH